MQPDDFDWLRAIRECDLATAFESLRTQVERDLLTIRELEVADALTSYQVVQPDSDRFSVWRRGPADRTAIDFILLDSCIEIKHLRGTSRVTQKFVSMGPCQLFLDGLPVEQWQIVRHALEPLLWDR